MSVPFGVLLNAEHEHKTLAELARHCEALGFSTLWYADERFFRETYTGLAVCAMVTERIALGTGVTDPYTRHPALTAMAAGSLDELSEGRAVIGFGAGRSGYHNIRIKPERAAQRTREAIEIIRGLLAGQTLDYRGQIFQTDDLSLKFPTRADIPLVLAADGPQMLRLAGEVADGVMIAHCVSEKILAEKVAYVREGQARAGRTHGPRIIARMDACVARDRAAAYHQLKRRLAWYLWFRYPNIPYLEQHGLSLPPELDRRVREAGPARRAEDLASFDYFGELIPDELVHPVMFAGTPDEVRGQIQHAISAGADEVVVYPLLPRGETWTSTLTLFAEAAGLRSQGGSQEF